MWGFAGFWRRPRAAEGIAARLVAVAAPMTAEMGADRQESGETGSS